jgi:predicted  nucleic acid-binding Zn-ribbon protein
LIEEGDKNMSTDDADVILGEIKKLRDQLVTLERKIDELAKEVHKIKSRVSGLK